jgi:hypothetical protein
MHLKNSPGEVPDGKSQGPSPLTNDAGVSSTGHMEDVMKIEIDIGQHILFIQRILLLYHALLLRSLIC